MKSTSPYLFADEESNSARLAELRRILAEDPSLDSVSDEGEFRAELAVLEAHAADRQGTTAENVPVNQDTEQRR